MPLTVAEYLSESGPASNNFVSRTLSFATPVPIGTRAVVAVELYTTTGVGATAGMISDDGGHTWVQDVFLDGDGSTGGVAILSATATSPITDITLTPGGSGNYGNWAIARLSGPAELDDADTGSGSSIAPATPDLTASTTDGVALSVISQRSPGGTQTQPSGWTMIEAETDNSSNLAGAIAHSPNISSAGSVSTTWGLTGTSQWYACAALYKASAPSYGDLTRIMGGQTDEGFFGNQALGGAQTSPLVTTFPVPIPAGYGLVVYQSLYNYTPSDASLFSLDGSGNALAKTAGAQTAHNAAGSDDNSVTFYHCILTSDCASCTFDPTSLPGGDSGRYGQIVFWVVKNPDTVTGFFTCTPATNTQTSTTSVNPGTLTLPTTDCLELFGGATRGHAVDLLPVVQSPDTWDVDLTHEFFDTVPGGGTDYPAAFQNSIIASGPVAARRNTSGGTSTPVWTFTGSSPTTGSAHSVLVAYNILGGSPVVSGTPLQNRINLLGIF